MARSKHSRALFEVIKQSQARQARKETAKPATSWWPFAKRADDGRTMGPRIARDLAEPHEPPAERDVSTVEQSDHEDDQIEAGHSVEPVADSHEPQTGGDESPEDASAAEAAATSHVTDRAADDDVTDESELPVATPLPAPTSVPRRQMQLSLSVPTMCIAAAAAFVLLVTAFLAGKHFSRPASSSGPSLVQIKNGKTFPEVLNLNPGQTKATLDAPAPQTQNAPPAAAPRKSVAPAGGPPADQQRVVGRNYIICQSYPDTESASKAADILVRNDVPCTVEQLDFAPGWYCVVTRVGFDRPSAAEYQRYEKMIRDLNAQAAAARVKKYDPYPYKWK